MLIREMWVVVNPSELSEMGDICFRSSPEKLAHYIIGCTHLGDAKEVINGMRLYVGSEAEREARADAEVRLSLRNQLTAHLRKMYGPGK